MLINTNLKLAQGAFEVVLPILWCIANCQHLLVMNFVVPLNRAEAFGEEESNWVPFSTILWWLLGQDCSSGCIGGISFDVVRAGGLEWKWSAPLACQRWPVPPLSISIWCPFWYGWIGCKCGGRNPWWTSGRSWHTQQRTGSLSCSTVQAILLHQKP